MWFNGEETNVCRTVSVLVSRELTAVPLVLRPQLCPLCQLLMTDGYGTAVEWCLQGESEFPEKNLTHYHFDSHECHMECRLQL